MKTIIKYELVINEALRSALNYHTPDEQINEFIRFFGRHIGSDRIYIFEDCKERHGTDNTYEWCAQGVTPEKDRLQNVDMDVIKWWYDTFSRGESIIITDIEDIKEEHRVSYDMLKAQNVRNVVVCPLRYKDEISGFFGVDNPPKSDYRGLTTFLDMIGTLLISFLKLRNSFIKSNKEAKLSSYSSLSKIYISMHLVDVQTKRYHIIKMTDQIVECLGKDFKKMGEYEIRDDFCGHIKNIAEKMCMESQLQELLEFVDISTLKERLLGENSIVHEFTDKISGWCRSRFIPVDYYCIRLVTILYSTEKICYTPSKTVLEDAVMPRYIVTLTNDEIQELKAIIQKGGKGYRIKHAQILLKLDQKPENKAWTYDRIKDAYGAARSTIAGIAQRFVMGGMEAALGRKVQENRRRKVTGDVEARICAIACSEPPEGASRWTMQAIADELIRLEVVDYITDSTVCEVMKKTKSSRGS